MINPQSDPTRLILLDDNLRDTQRCSTSGATQICNHWWTSYANKVMQEIGSQFLLGGWTSLPPSLFRAIQSTEEELEESPRIVKYIEMNSVLPAG